MFLTSESDNEEKDPRFLLSLLLSFVLVSNIIAGLSRDVLGAEVNISICGIADLLLGNFLGNIFDDAIDFAFLVFWVHLVDSGVSLVLDDGFSDWCEGFNDLL